MFVDNVVVAGAEATITDLDADYGYTIAVNQFNDKGKSEDSQPIFFARSK